MKFGNSSANKTVNNMEDSTLIAEYMGLQPMKGISEYNGNEYWYYNNAKMQDYEALPTYKEWNELMPVIERIEKDDSIMHKTYSWKIGSEIRYNFEGFRFTLYEGGAYSEMNLSLDPPMEIAKSFDKEKSWIENVFTVVVETIKYINEKL